MSLMIHEGLSSTHLGTYGIIQDVRVRSVTLWVYGIRELASGGYPIGVNMIDE